MDTRPISEEDFARLLTDLDQVNRLTRAAAPTLSFLDRLADGWPAGRPLAILDLGYGSGQMLRRIYRWGRMRGIDTQLAGIDLNPHCRKLAQKLTPADMRIEWHQGDLFEWNPSTQPDVIISSLFAHHLSDEELVRLLRWQDRMAGIGWFVNDLHRHVLAWSGFRLMAAAARWHPFVRHDGALSVRRAFTRGDWMRLLEEAGVEGARISWHLPFRLCVARQRA